jgi:uncharacterized protein
MRLSSFSAYRRLLTAWTLIATSWAAAGSAQRAAPVAPKIPLAAEPFASSAVRLLDGPFKASQDVHAKYLLSLDTDRLLARFRQEAGLDPKAENYPGWETKELPGVGASFYLSGCSRLYAATGDKRFLDRVNKVLDEFEACQKANGDGFLLATKNGKRIFSEIGKGDIRFTGGWILNGEAEPYYAMEKLFSGLRDAYRVAGQAKALDIEVALADWLVGHMSALSDEQLQTIMACEYGGMNWVLSDLYVDTGDSRYLDLSKSWHHKAIFDPLAQGQDILPGKHANTQFPKISGLAARYPYSTDLNDRIIAEFFWDRVVHHHSYVTGDNSFGEHFGPPDHLSDRLGENTTETCNAWNMVRLTSLLASIEARAEYGDFIERILWNHILPAQHPADGRVCYFVPLSSGHSKPYETLYDRFACCTCSGFDSYARHNEWIYMHSSNELFVNLFIASEVRWQAKGVTVRQETRFPDEEIVRLSMQCDSPVRFKLAVRCPFWAKDGLTFSINGTKSPLSGQPGNYAALDREWTTGDSVEIRLAMPLRQEVMPDNPRKVAFFKGPILLAGDLGPADDPAAQDQDYVPVVVPGDRPIQQWLVASTGPLEFTLSGAGKPRDVPLKPFFRLHDRRYCVYWDILTTDQWTALKSQRDAERAREEALEARTLDKVDIGIPASEAGHNLKSEGSNTGFGAYGKHMRTRWRDAAGGWFSYEVKVLTGQATVLSVTYWGKEIGDRTFDLLVDDKRIGTTTLDSNHPEQFYDVTYTIPAEATAGKEKVTIRFEAHPGNTAGGVFGIRTFKNAPVQ